MEQTLNTRTTKFGLEINFSKSIESSKIQDVTESVYLEAWRSALSMGFSEIIRIWNYIPEINRFTEGIENYQHFCAGRKNAYNRLNIDQNSFPAASAVGSQGSSIQFRFLFGKTKPMPISNRLQIEAYDYPNEYGPTSPSFARAAVIDSMFFLSGTASIRGHKTMFLGDLDGQIKCTIENIDEVINKAQQTLKKPILKNQMSWRVYMRDPAIETKIKSDLEEKLGKSIEFVSAEICRSDLLIEIEGAYYGL
tara:strand:- start:64637 stop:65389 length:753 start_codon:yes stop_codon:yes gene_type:complete